MGTPRVEHPAGWTEERVSSLKKWWLEGQSASQITKQLGGGVTRNAVIGKIHRLGLTGRAAPSQPARTTPRSSRPRSVQGTTSRSKPALPSKVPEVPAEPPKPAVPEQPGIAVLETLEKRMCKWPIGDPGSDEFSFCGRRSGQGVYCIEHAKVAYQPKTKRTNGDQAHLSQYR